MKKLILPALAALALPAAAQQMTPEQMQKMMEAAGKALGAIAANATNAAPAALVDFRDLKALLPAEIDGMKGQLKGSRNAAMGMSVSQAEGQYADDKGASLTVKIADVSGVGGLGAMAFTAWTSVEVDNESDEGYEKTTTIDGHKAMEKYTTASKSGQINVFVDRRFSIEISGSGLPMEKI